MCITHDNQTNQMFPNKCLPINNNNNYNTTTNETTTRRQTSGPDHRFVAPIRSSVQDARVVPRAHSYQNTLRNSCVWFRWKNNHHKFDFCFACCCTIFAILSSKKFTFWTDPQTCKNNSITLTFFTNHLNTNKFRKFDGRAAIQHLQAAQAWHV